MYAMTRRGERAVADRRVVWEPVVRRGHQRSLPGEPTVEESGVIAQYVDRLARELAFDPALSRRVRREAEDHLREALAAQPAADRTEAERRAVAAFGDPRVIAAQFAGASLAKQATRVAVAALLAITVAFMAMKARTALYAVMQWPAGDTLGTLRRIVGAVDHATFWVAVVAGIAGWIYIESRRVPPALTEECRAASSLPRPVLGSHRRAHRVGHRRRRAHLSSPGQKGMVARYPDPRSLDDRRGHVRRPAPRLPPPPLPAHHLSPPHAARLSRVFGHSSAGLRRLCSRAPRPT